MSIYSAIISGGLPVAKAPNENGSDGEERKLGEQTGLDSGVFVDVDFCCLFDKTDLTKMNK